jgi:hypothetical protein
MNGFRSRISPDDDMCRTVEELGYHSTISQPSSLGTKHDHHGMSRRPGKIACNNGRMKCLGSDTMMGGQRQSKMIILVKSRSTLNQLINRTLHPSLGGNNHQIVCRATNCQNTVVIPKEMVVVSDDGTTANFYLCQKGNQISPCARSWAG